LIENGFRHIVAYEGVDKEVFRRSNVIFVKQNWRKKKNRKFVLFMAEIFKITNIIHSRLMRMREGHAFLSRSHLQYGKLHTVTVLDTELVGYGRL
jgi:hypothetical protein